MISRVAESCFWLNRYVERVEVLATMLDVNLSFQLDVDLADAERWLPLIVVTGEEAGFIEQTPPERIDDAETVQHFLSWDESNPSSLFSSLRAARDNARTIRETISLEMWEALNDLWVWIQQPEAKRAYETDRHVFYRRLRDQCRLFHGAAQATMLHEDPFEFCRLGTAIERAGQTARILDVKHHSVGPTRETSESPAEAAQWLATLRFCSGFEPFFKRQYNELSGRAVAAFLLFDPAFPRSVLHNLHRARNFLNLVRPDGDSPIGARTHALVDETLEHFAKMNIETVLAEGLHEVVTWIVEVLADIAQAIAEEFFDPTSVADGTQRQTQTQRSA